MLEGFHRPGDTRDDFAQKHPFIDRMLRKKGSAAAIASLAVAHQYYRFMADQRLGWTVLFDKQLNEVPSSVKLSGLPERTMARMRRILFARGLLHDNFFMTKSMREGHDELLACLEANNAPAVEMPLPRVNIEQMTADAFFEAFIKRPHPVVIEGFQARAKHWTVDWFMQKFGDVQVLVSDNNANENRMAPLRSEQIFHKHPELTNELGLEEAYRFMKSPLSAMQMFLGMRKGTGSPFHCAMNYNLFLQLDGKKKWTFVDPEYTLLMYPVVSDYNAYQASLVGMPEEVDLDRFPLYRYCPRFSVTLEPGDAMLNPPWWYHAVENVTDHTLAVATRWLSNVVPPGYKDPNHVYTALNYLTPGMNVTVFKHVYEAVQGRWNTPTTLPLDGDDLTTFEKRSHDSVERQIGSGELDRSWMVPKARASVTNGAPTNGATGMRREANAELGFT
jgi:hypothetical protein